MKPVNNKSMLAFIFGQMEKLDNGSIDVEKAKAQSNLAKQANNSLRYEIDRAKIKMQIAEHNKEFESDVSLREVESKNFKEENN